MYGTEFPPCLFEQVTVISDRAFLAIEEAHHLRWERQKKKVRSVIALLKFRFTFLPAYR